MDEPEHEPFRCGAEDLDDTVADYLAGRLSGAAAEAFEEHYVGCPRCYRRLERALEIRAALAAAPVPRVPVGFRRRLLQPSAWRPLAAAALLALVVGGGLLWSSRSGGPPAAEVLRGREPLTLELAAPAGGLDARWPAVPGADRYRFRLFSASGDLLLERLASAPRLDLGADELAGLPRGVLLYGKVDAFDLAGQRLASSDLHPVSLPRGGP